MCDCHITNNVIINEYYYNNIIIIPRTDDAVLRCRPAVPCPVAWTARSVNDIESTAAWSSCSRCLRRVPADGRTPWPVSAGLSCARLRAARADRCRGAAGRYVSGRWSVHSGIRRRRSPAAATRRLPPPAGTSSACTPPAFYSSSAPEPLPSQSERMHGKRPDNRLCLYRG